MKTFLVNFPRKTPEELNTNLPWVGAKINGEMVYHSYYTEAKDKKQAVRTAIKLLRKKELEA
jgi:hypothetical protein